MTGVEALAIDISTDLERATLVYADEIQLHEQIGQVLDASGFEYEREVRLADGLGRIDFVVEGCLGIEVKIKGSRRDVYRQVRLYTLSSVLEGVLLVTTRSQHAGIAKELEREFVQGVPAYQVSLLEGGL